MFVPDANLTHIEARREQIVSIIESINHPHVGVPGHDTQATEAWVVGRRNRDGSFSMLVYLWLTEARRPVIYVSDPRTFEVEQFRQIEAEALQFVESMGFMVDNVNFRNLSPLQQEEVMKRVPCFDPDAAARAEPEPEPEPGLSLDEDEAPLQLEPELELLGGDGPAPYDLDDDIPELEEVEPLGDVPAIDEQAARRVGRLLASF